MHRIFKTKPILEFWGPYAERGGGGGGGGGGGRGGGGGGVGMKEWIQCIYLCFTPSRITLTESAHFFHGSMCIRLKQETVRHSHYMIWLIFT